jgi:hypothetical protein
LTAHRRFPIVALSVLACLGASSVSAQTVIPQSSLVPSNGYYTDSIGGGLGSVAVMTGGANSANIGLASGRNDDGFSGPLNLGFTLDFFGQSYTTFYANNNGSISFGNGISAYIPNGPTGAQSPVISPWFGDVDTRGALSGVMYVRTDIANEIIVTWDGVGYFGNHDDKLDSFQLVVRGSGYDVPTGEGSIGFFYQNMEWERTDTSTVAAVGFGNGSGQGEVLQGSTQPGLNTVVANHHLWFDQTLAVVPPPVSAVPEPETYALMLGGLALTAWVARRRKSA